MVAPAPLITPTSRPYWDGLLASRIDLQRCNDCDAWIFYPRLVCPHCGGSSLRWQTASGDAVLYSFCVTEAPTSPDFADALPQLLAVVELREGIRIPSTLVDVSPEAIVIGMALVPVFDHSTFDGIALLRFRPAGDG